MASSNRHWPSMFKSKPCNNQPWQQPHDINHSSVLSNSCGRSTAFSSGCEERSPEPKPRWNPKPEQIRILEAIFNSGMVNPPRDEIRRIRAQLQEYGQVGDANVFYWFQNRKSRSKHKQRSLQNSAKVTATSINHNSPPVPTSSSSSTSSDKSPKKPKSMNSNSSNSSNNTNVVVEQFGINSPTNSVNQCSYFQHLVGNQEPPIFFPLQQSGASIMGNFSQGLCFSTNNHININANPNLEMTTPPSDHSVGGFSSLLLGEMIGSGGSGGGGAGESKGDHEAEKLKFQQELSFLVSNAPNTSCAIPSSSLSLPTPASGAISSSLGQILGVGDVSVVTKTTVFIDDVAFEVPVGPINLKEAFGEDSVLVYPSGHPVLTNEWGVTLHPLQPGAFYYVMRSTAVAASPLLDKLDHTTPGLLSSSYPYQI